MKKYFYCEMSFYNKHGDFISIKKQFFCEQEVLNKRVGNFILELRQKNKLFSGYYFNGWQVISDSYNKNKPLL